LLPGPSRQRLAAIAAFALLPAACAGPADLPQGARYVRPPSPHYPFTMREQGIEGTVKVAVVIGRDGKPRNMWIAESSGHASFDNEAMNALSLAVWAPLTKETTVMVPINFVIKN
jgi:protein TonB